MKTTPDTQRRATSRAVKSRIEKGGERLWKFEDFADLPFSAVAKTLSRLTRQGMIERLSKGVYYRSRPTAFGKSRPNPMAMRKFAAKRKAMFPSGVAAANVLGFSTQNPRRPEIATSGLSLPRKLIGDNAVIRTRRPAAWEFLSEENAAFLDFLRQAGKSSELSPEDTVRKALAMLSEEGRFESLVKVADTEPPRVRAMLGALGEELGKKQKLLERLRNSLNPLSRFDFGMLSSLRHAARWNAKNRQVS